MLTQSPNSISQSVKPFCRAYERDQQTDTKTDRPHYNVRSNRPLSLANAAMRPNNTIILTKAIVIFTQLLWWMQTDSAQCGRQPSNRANQLVPVPATCTCSPVGHHRPYFTVTYYYHSARKLILIVPKGTVEGWVDLGKAVRCHLPGKIPHNDSMSVTACCTELGNQCGVLDNGTHWATVARTSLTNSISSRVQATP